MQRPTLSDGVIASKAYHSANCKTQRYRVRTIIQYGIDGEVVATGEDGDKGSLFSAAPDSIDYNLLRYVCSANRSV